MRIRLGLVASILGLSIGCSDAGLEPIQGDENAPVDNRLMLSGTICTDPPSDELFPMKVMLISDTSGSLQFTDQANQRVVAIQQLMDRYAGNAAVQFSVIAFDAVTQELTPGFTSNPDIAAVSARLSVADRLTDYQGALAAAYNTLTHDMRTASPAQLARSKYVIIFFSDGTPDPNCRADAPPGTGLLVCQIDRAEWPDTFSLPPGNDPRTGQPWTWAGFMTLYPDLQAGRDYNTLAQLQQSVRDIMELQEIYGVNEIRLHTGFLFDPNTIPAAIQAFGLDRDAGVALLTGLAEAGNGTFTEFSSGGEISFLNINYTSVKQPYAMTNLIVENRSAIPERRPPENVVVVDGFVPDSDGDGLPDYLEAQAGLCAYERGGATCRIGNTNNFRDPFDTDGDGYGDLFEYKNRSSGFNPAYADALTAVCNTPDDSDGDGLRDCEEAFIGTHPSLLDSDGDRIPDGVEYRAGLDPRDRSDALKDNDSDGVRNFEEVLGRWDANQKEPAEALPPRYEYKVTYLGVSPEGRSCYDFEVDNIRLVTTQGLTPQLRGRNRIWLHFLEGPPDNPRDFGSGRVACVDTQYIAPYLKAPARGRIVLTEDDFYAPNDAAIECVPSNRPLPGDATAEEPDAP